MKIVGVSNFGLESVSDILVEENLQEEIAMYRCNLLNFKQTENSTYWYRVVEDNYKLFDHTSLY